jgi:2-C-methyl-D-erythritol 4-phosphate cytidylyltransferase
VQSVVNPNRKEIDGTAPAHETPPVSNASIPVCTAIIVAAGSSRRMGFDKLSAPLGGVPVLQRTLDAFLAADCISSIIIVCPAERWDLLGDPERFTKSITRVDGGKDRQDSVAQGLAALPDGTELVAVHDGARPLVHPDDIARCVAEAAIHRAATLARRVTETLKRSDDEAFCTGAVSRENLWFMETPQIFQAGLLKQAYAKVAEENLTITDEVSAAEALGVKVKFVESMHANLKVTTPADLGLAEALLGNGANP